MTSAPALPLRVTPLTELHRAAGARMVPFAGYEMPISYPSGIVSEHHHTREAASLFDVSHMGQCLLEGPDVVARLEQLVPGDIEGLAEGALRYTVLLNDAGGVLDDLMVMRLGPTRLFLVVNASRKAGDFALLREHVGGLTVLDDRALVAVQGPRAAEAVGRRVPGAPSLSFMRGRVDGDLIVTRSGYTGEDGVEISLPAEQAASFVTRLMEDSALRWAGLGARDTLRLEAGLCLYGHELDETTSPVEAGLSWVIAKRRRTQDLPTFPGAARLLKELAEGPRRIRVGIRPDGGALARDGTAVFNREGEPVGQLTSGGYSPTLGGPVAMGYVETAYGEVDTPLLLDIRGEKRTARVVPLPFVPHAYRSGP